MVLVPGAPAAYAKRFGNKPLAQLVEHVVPGRLRGMTLEMSYIEGVAAGGTSDRRSDIRERRRVAESQESSRRALLFHFRFRHSAILVLSISGPS